MIVDEMHHEHPELIKDQYWDEVFPSELPYTLASEGNRESAPIPSTAKIEVPSSQQAVVMSSSSMKIDELVREQSVNYKFPPPEVRHIYKDARMGTRLANGLHLANHAPYCC